MGIPWDEFVGTGADDGFVQKWVGRMFWPYLACTVLSLTARRRSWIQMSGLVCGSAFLTLLSYAKYVGAQRQPPMFVEHGGQMLMPVVLVSALALGARNRVTITIACTAMVMTFAGHGSYAAGLWPTPPTFFGMTSVILGVDYDFAKRLLLVAGILDFAVCAAPLVPMLRRPATLYAFVWGLLTAMARPVSGMSFDLIHWGADQYLHEMILRAPHFMIPLYLFLLWSPTQSIKTSANVT